MTEVLVDNDVLYKTAMYGLVTSMVGAAPYGANRFNMLGAARFMIHKKIEKHPPARGREAALAEFAEAIGAIDVLEPTLEETRIAAELEYRSGELNLDLDGGESILCAVLINRSHDYIFTGDKRAIAAVNELLVGGVFQELVQKLVCLEQIFVCLLKQMDAQSVKAAICTEPTVDRSLTNCFGCRSDSLQLDSLFEGLNSYIGHLKIAAPNALADAR